MTDDARAPRSGGGAAQPGGTSAPTLRVLSYNVKSLQMDAAAVRDVIRESDPDVVAIQEPCRYLTGGRRRMRALAAATGTVCVVPGGSPFGAYTTALLVARRHEGSVVRRRGRPLSWRWWRRRDLRAWPTRRGSALVDLGDVVVVSVHLGLDARERLEHCAEVSRLVERAGSHRCVVAGDLNEEPGGPSWQALGSLLRDAAPEAPGLTFAAPRPVRRIDGVLVGDGFEVLSSTVLRTPAALRGSDHLPVLVELRRRWQH